MPRSAIFTVDPDGTLTAMRPSQPRNEDFMQALVAAHPELIADEDGALLLIQREHPIADREDGSGRWSLDHLFVTRDAIPVLVELKRASDTRLRREVIGQMLDYAANGTAYWKGGRIAERFASTMADAGSDADAELAAFLGSGADPGQFWEQVDANFVAGRFKMVFVADIIPPELAQIVEFLNEQMKADVRAVELSWFESDGGITALTPRVIGETERAQSEKAARTKMAPISVEDWIEQRLSPLGHAAFAAAQSFVSIVEETGGRPEVASTQGSIGAVYDSVAGKLQLLMLAPNSGGAVQLCLGYLAYRPAFADPDVRQALYDKLVAIVGPLSTKTLNGYPGFNVAKLLEESVRVGVVGFLREILSNQIV